MIKYESLKKAVSILKLKTSNPDVDTLMSDRNLLIDLVEQSAEALRLLEGEIKDLRDEVNRLKGEQSSLKFSRKKAKADISSEEERKAIENEESKDKKSKEKKSKIKITRSELCVVEKSALPTDAVFKGYETVIVQDIKISADNIEFKKEVYYSPSLGKSITGILPPGYDGEFGSNIKSLILSLYTVRS